MSGAKSANSVQVLTNQKTTLTAPMCLLFTNMAAVVKNVFSGFAADQFQSVYAY